MSGAAPRYRILRRLGQGGMAEVFEAELVGEHGFSRRVALKRMLGDAAADPAAAQRFLDEARIASRLHHGNIVAVLDVGTLDDLPFQVLEYVDGLNAEQLRARAALPLEIALVIASEVAHGLDHAHTATDTGGVPLGIVHRDVKPSNVLVGWNGDVKLGDFGIAVARERAAVTEAGVVAGTLGFIAPEQRTRSQLDGRTDVFALGLTLHALITGRSPLADADAELRVLAGEPVPLDPAIPADVREILTAALAIQRLDRPSAGQLAAALAPRLPRDPKRYLRGYLATLEQRPGRGGVLDQLLGIDVVMDAAGDGVRRFHTVVAGAAPPRRSRGALVAIAGIAVLGAGGVAVWRLAGTPHAAAPDAAVARAADAAADGPLDAAVVVEVEVDAAVPHKVHRAVHPDAAVAETGIGYLQVTGDAFVRAKVLVDGALVGYVPNLLEVHLGHHRIEAIAPDGTRRTSEIDVTSFHTIKHPLRLSW